MGWGRLLKSVAILLLCMGLLLSMVTAVRPESQLGGGAGSSMHYPKLLPPAQDLATPMAGAGWQSEGFLEGDVLDSEVANGTPPCTAAQVHVEPGGMDIPVDLATGHYGPTALAEGVYTLTALANGYAYDGSQTVIITDALTTTQDLSLWRPVVTVSPTALVSVTGYIGQEVTYSLTITNAGHLPLAFEIREVTHTAEVAGEQAVPPVAFNWLEGKVRLDPVVLEELEDKGMTDFFVRMRLQADLGPAYGIRDWRTRGWYVYNALKAAAEAQAPILGYGRDHELECEGRLVINAVFFKDGTLEDINALAERVDVIEIRPNLSYSLDHGNQPGAPGAWGWNLDELDPNSDLFGIEAAQVWEEFGVRGECDGCGYDGGDYVVVANIDTGVYYQHEALDRQYRGNLTGQIGGPYDHDYDWYMPTSGCPSPSEPCDNQGHGSGTMGLMVGETEDLAERIGVAPHARWIACKGCEYTGCSEAALTACGDWMLAPTRTDGSGADPEKRPHIINNSWGAAGCDDWYLIYVNAWRAVGILPVFSTGGTVACAAIGSPGDYVQVLTPASHGPEGINLYAGGPSCFAPDPSCDPDAHQVKPNLNAPTFARTSDNSQGGYSNLGGSSASSPHAAGCAALVLSANPDLVGFVSETFAVLEQTADRSSTQPWNEGGCGKPACAGDDPYPNYEYGWGYLDCYAAVESVFEPEVPWMRFEPISGTIPISGLMEIGVTFHCTETRDYTSTLQILHNDPCQDVIDVPVLLRCQKLPDLWIDAEYEQEVLAGDEVTLTLLFGNDGGLEIDAWIWSEFGPEVPLTQSEPPPDEVDPGGLWARWDISNLEEGEHGGITATVTIKDALEPCTWLSVTNQIFDHTGSAVDRITVTLHVTDTLCVELVEVNVHGQASGMPGTYTFTAIHEPSNAAPPITYLWSDGSTSPTIVRDLGMGTHTLEVTATNCTDAMATGTHTIVISQPACVYLPLVLKNQ